MDDVKKIAAGLNRSQIDAIGHLSDIGKPWKMPPRWNVLVGYSLESLGMTKRTFWTGKTRLTSLGLAVRAYLKDQEHG